MTQLEALAHEERILETTSDAITLLIGRGLEEGRIKLIRAPGVVPSIDWDSAAAYLNERPEYWDATNETQRALETLQADFEEGEPCH